MENVPIKKGEKLKTNGYFNLKYFKFLKKKTKLICHLF